MGRWVSPCCFNNGLGGYPYNYGNEYPWNYGSFCSPYRPCYGYKNGWGCGFRLS